MIEKIQMKFNEMQNLFGKEKIENFKFKDSFMNKEHLESNNKKLEELQTLAETLNTVIIHTRAVVEQAIEEYNPDVYEMEIQGLILHLQADLKAKARELLEFSNNIK